MRAQGMLTKGDSFLNVPPESASDGMPGLTQCSVEHCSHSDGHA